VPAAPGACSSRWTCSPAARPPRGAGRWCAGAARGRRGAALALDTSDLSSFPAFADALRAELGDREAFDVLVNNAGTALYAPLAEVTEAQ